MLAIKSASPTEMALPSRTISTQIRCVFISLPWCTIAEMLRLHSHAECLQVLCQFGRLRNKRLVFSQLEIKGGDNSYPRKGKSYTPIQAARLPAATAAAFAGPSMEASRAPRFWSTSIAVSASVLSEQGT